MWQIRLNDSGDFTKKFSVIVVWSAYSNSNRCLASHIWTIDKIGLTLKLELLTCVTAPDKLTFWVRSPPFLVWKKPPCVPGPVSISVSKIRAEFSSTGCIRLSFGQLRTVAWNQFQSRFHAIKIDLFKKSAWKFSRNSSPYKAKYVDFSKCELADL